MSTTDNKSKRDVHIRKHSDDATAKPVWCGETGVASITEAWGFYGHGRAGHDDVCRVCIGAERRTRSGTL